MRVIDSVFGPVLDIPQPSLLSVLLHAHKRPSFRFPLHTHQHTQTLHPATDANPSNSEVDCKSPYPPPLKECGKDKR